VTTRRPRLTLAGLLAGGAFALHQLRYLLGYGAESHGQLASQGHAYMTLLAPAVAVALMLVAADLCARVIRARAGRSPERARGLLPMWSAVSACLLATYAIQETLEGALAPGHPGGLAGVLGHGGWAAIPLAAAIGLVIALVVRGVERVVELVAEPAVRVRRPVPSVSVSSFASESRLSGLFRSPGLGARAPPIASIP
jgi:hypothetical protein